MATTDYFLKLEGYPPNPGITGESTDANHKGEIEIESFSWGIHQSLNIGSQSTGAGAGKVTFTSVSFVARSSAATASLFQACCAGTAFQTGTLTIRKAGGTQEDYMKVIMKLCAISDYNHIGVTGVDLIPRDEFKMLCGGIQIQYATQNKDGGLAAPIKKGWDFTLNKVV